MSPKYDYRNTDDKGAAVLVPSGYDERGRAIEFTVKKLKALRPRISIHDADGFTEIYHEPKEPYSASNVVWPPDFWWCGDCGSGWSAMTDKSSARGLLHAVKTGHYVSLNKNHKMIYRLKGGIPMPYP